LNSNCVQGFSLLHHVAYWGEHALCGDRGSVTIAT